MNARTKEESAGPLGVIGCLTAGFEILSRNLGLMALPVLLDLLLWLGPRLSMAPMLRQLAALLMAQPMPDPATARQIEQAVQLLELFGEQFNLLSLLSVLPLLNVPSLLAQHMAGMLSPLGEPRVLWVTSAFALMAWGVLLVPVGLVLGFLYLNNLARRVRAMRSAGGQGLAQPRVKEAALSADGTSVAEGAALSASGTSVAEGTEQAARKSSALPKFLRVFLFSTGLLMTVMVLVPLWLLLIGTLLTIAQPVGFLAWALSIGLGGYVALHLLFVVPGVVVGGRGLWQAIWESIALIHTQFPSVVGLLVLVVVIYEGLGYVWSLPFGDSWSLLIGILGNGCIATGLTAATFVFYQERVSVVSR